MPLIATLMLWLNAYGEKTQIAGYSKTGLLTYYIIGYLVQEITGSYYEEGVLNQIREGSISNQLTKPYSFKIALMVKEIGWRALALISTVLPLIIVVNLVFPDIFFEFKLINLFSVLPFLLFAYLLENVYSLLVVAMGFIFEEAHSLTHLKWMIGWLLSGSMMPFEFLPSWLAQIAQTLPFKFRYYLPVQVLQGKLSPSTALLSFAGEVAWFVILLFGLQLLWKKNIKQFTAVGS